VVGGRWRRNGERNQSQLFQNITLLTCYALWVTGSRTGTRGGCHGVLCPVTSNAYQIAPYHPRQCLIPRSTSPRPSTTPPASRTWGTPTRPSSPTRRPLPQAGRPEHVFPHRHRRTRAKDG
jgi:hypothetical protein